MLVPRSFKYTSSPWADPINEKGRRRSVRKTSTAPPDNPPFTTASSAAATTTTAPVTIPSAGTIDVSTPHRTGLEEATHSMPSYKSATLDSGRPRKPSAHDPSKLPPAVAALLAVTAIPPRKPDRYRNRVDRDRRISIEELVQGWKSDASLKSSYGSSPALSALLEDNDGDLEERLRTDGDSEPGYLNERSDSSDSMPSLDSDDRSVLSLGSPSTPGSLRSRKSSQNLKKDKSRSLPASVDCAADHPLASNHDADQDDDFLLPTEKKPLPPAKARSSFKSNLTTSLQSLKNAAVSSISSLSRSTSTPTLGRTAAPPIDDMLWSHPFLFPRFSSEIRPAAVESLPSQAERRYLNPVPLTFEEQEAPFQQALHAPYLAEAVQDAPTIPMQTYHRGRRRSNVRRASAPNPTSEAGRALLGAAGVRQREVRENPDFLRVVVLEMNMRREGKLEQGRAKIWLPPRQAGSVAESRDQVPVRWRGVSAE